MFSIDQLQFSKHKKTDDAKQSYELSHKTYPESLPSLQSSSSSPTLSTTTSSSKRQSLLNHSHLKPGQNASLLSYSQTIQMYGDNAKKINNMDVLYDFATFLAEGAQQMETSVFEAEKILKQTALRGHEKSQYYLATMYATGLLNQKQHGQPEFEKALPFYLQSTKHHHPDAAFRSAVCYENGLGTRKDKSKANQYYRKAATSNHPGAMYRLGTAYLKGQLNLAQNTRDGHKWLKRSVEAATSEYPHALHELAILHERGLDAIIFVDHPYALSLYHKAADLGYAPSAFCLGECYRLGKLGCKPDPERSLQFYQAAADQQHPDACLALAAWYLVGIPNLLTPSDHQAYQWILSAAETGHARAEYLLGYFLEKGIGVLQDPAEAMMWYQKAAEQGEARAIERLTKKETKKNKRSSLVYLYSMTRRLSLLFDI